MRCSRSSSSWTTRPRSRTSSPPRPRRPARRSRSRPMSASSSARASRSKESDFAAEVAAAAGTAEARAGRLSLIALGRVARRRLRCAPPCFLSPESTLGSPMPRPRFNRILLKLSGEALMGEGQFGIDPDTVARLAEEIKAAVDGRPRALPGRRRRQHLPRPGRRRQGLRPGQRRLYGHAGDGDERARHAERAREDRRRHPRPVGDPDGDRLRALYPPPRGAAHGEGPGGDLRRRHRQSLLHHRHRRRACAPPRWAATPCSRAPASTASTMPIRRRCRTQSVTKQSAFNQVLVGQSEGDGRHRGGACAATTIFRSSCSTSASRAIWPACSAATAPRRSCRTEGEGRCRPMTRPTSSAACTARSRR